MSMNKEQALRANGIVEIYDVYTDAYRLQRTKPAEHMQLLFYRDEYEHLSVNEIYNMFDRRVRYEDDFVHLGPTNAELRDPRIKNAWEEFMIIKKLIGVK